MLPGDTWMGSGPSGAGAASLLWWKFSTTTSASAGTSWPGRIEFSTPLVSHTFANVGHFEVTLSAWWQDQGRGAETVNGRDVWVVQLDISSDTRLTAATAPDSRSELGIGEITDCTLAVLPADTPLNVWWTVNGAGKPGPAPPGLPTDLAYPVTAKLQPGQCTVTASIGRAYAQREFTVIEPLTWASGSIDTAPHVWRTPSWLPVALRVRSTARPSRPTCSSRDKPDLDFDGRWHALPRGPKTRSGWRVTSQTSA